MFFLTRNNDFVNHGISQRPPSHNEETTIVELVYRPHAPEQEGYVDDGLGNGLRALRLQPRVGCFKAMAAISCSRLSEVVCEWDLARRVSLTPFKLQKLKAPLIFVEACTTHFAPLIARSSQPSLADATPRHLAPSVNQRGTEHRGGTTTLSYHQQDVNTFRIFSF